MAPLFIYMAKIKNPIRRLNPKEPPLGFREIGNCNKCDSPVWEKPSILSHGRGTPIFNCMCHLSPIQTEDEHKQQKATPKKLDIKRIESKPKNFYL
jgi:hypothetical protein